MRQISIVHRMLICACVGFGTPALGQVAELPQAITRKVQLGASDLQQITEFVESQRRLVETGDQTSLKRARDAMLKPLELDNITIPFRQAYDSAVRPIGLELAADADPVRAMAGYRLLGALGTDASSLALLDAIGSTDQSIRFFIVAQLGEALHGMASTAPGMSESGAKRVIEALGTVIGETDDATLADGAIRALGEATRISEANFEDVRSLAIIELASRTGDRLRATRSTDPDVVAEMIAGIRAASFVYNAVSDRSIIATNASAKAAISLGADAVGLVFSRSRSGAIAAEGDDTIDVRLVGVGEFAIYYGKTALTGQSGLVPTNLSKQLDDGDLREFNNRAAALIGSESDLVRDLGADGTRFIRPPAED